MTIYSPELASSLQRRNLYLFVRRVFAHLEPGEPFLEAPYVEAMCFALQEVAERRERRLLITVPPRYLKTICASVALPAWLLGRDPRLQILVASYGHDLAAKPARSFRSVVESDWYRRLFPRMRIDDRRNTALEIETTMRGSRKAVSVGGPVTGFGADITIIDDLMKSDNAQSETERQRVKNYYEQTLYSRLNDKANGAIVVVQQRLHEDDFAGYLIARQEFRHLNLPAIAERNESIPLYLEGRFQRRAGEALCPAREPLPVLQEIRRTMGSATFSAQYLQDPVYGEGNLLRPEWFGSYEAPIAREHFLYVVQSWDTAMTAEPTSDFTVCTTWGFRDAKWYLLDLLRRRLEYSDIKRAIIRQRQRWQPALILVEAAATGIPLVQELSREGMEEIDFCRPNVDKMTRVIAQSAKLEAGLVLIPEAAEWRDDFLHEIRAFPIGRYDDQVDSLTQFLWWTSCGGGLAWQERMQNGGRPRGHMYTYRSTCRSRRSRMEGWMSRF
jgi:predicted phage terminase large subunit-like protein